MSRRSSSTTSVAGTLDVTLLEAQDGTFFEQASKGIRKMGGLDLDKALGRKILETVPDHESWGTGQRTAFWLAVERAKILLSTQEETNVELPNGEYHRVTRKIFEDAVRPLIERTRDPILQCLADMQDGALSDRRARAGRRYEQGPGGSRTSSRKWSDSEPAGQGWIP